MRLGSERAAKSLKQPRSKYYFVPWPQSEHQLTKKALNEKRSWELYVKVYKNFELKNFIFPYPRFWTKVPLVLLLIEEKIRFLDFVWNLQYGLWYKIFNCFLQFVGTSSSIKNKEHPFGVISSLHLPRSPFLFLPRFVR